MYSCISSTYNVNDLSPNIDAVRRTNKSVIEEIKAKYPLEELLKKQQLSYFGHYHAMRKWFGKLHYVGNE